MDYCHSQHPFQAGRNNASKTSSPNTCVQTGQKNQRAQYVAEIKKSLHPGVSVAHQIFQAAEARLKMSVMYVRIPYSSFMVTFCAVLWKRSAQISANLLLMLK
jgi:hypothetical protein